MKRIVFYTVVILLLVGTGLFFLRPARPAKPAQEISVVVSGYVPYTLARQIGRGGPLHIQMLLPPNAEPHAFEPTPGSIVAVHHAAVFGYVSDALEPWVKDVLGAAGGKTRVVELAQGIPAGKDPHVWMDFDFVRLMAQAWARAFCQVDPDHAELYQENLADFERTLVQLDNEFSQGLRSCQSREVVHVGHLAFSALAKRYNLSLSSLAGASHDAEHSARKLAELVQLVRQRQVPAVFTEEAVSGRLAQTLAVETGTSLLPLYTIEHVSKADFNNGVTYAQLMRRNLASLKQGLVCQP